VVNTGSVDSLEIGVSGGHAFFGVGGPYWTDSNGDGTIDATDTPAAAGAIGLALSNVKLALALMTPVAGSTLTTTAKLKSFTALEAGGDVALVGVDGLTATVENFTIDINQAQLLPGATTTARAIDFSGTKKHSIEVGPDPDGDGGPLTAPTVDLAFAGTIFQAAGTVTFAIDDYVYVKGSVAFQKGAPLTGLKLSNGADAGPLTALQIGASGVTAFVGTGYGTS
jgi:hypothetical protein